MLRAKHRHPFIAVVGGGIAGPALAAALADTRLPVTLVERHPGPLDTVRGDHLQPVTCAALERWGALPHLLALGAEKRLGSRWFNRRGEEILHAQVDDLDIPHPYYLYLNHELIGRALLERAAANPAFRLLRPATARLVANEPGAGYALQVEGANGRETLRAALVIAADGRNSTTRRALAVPSETYAYHNPLVILFVPRAFADPRNEVRAYLTPAGIVSVIPRTGGFWKIGFPVRRAELNGWLQASEAELARRLGELVPALAGLRPERAGIYPVAMVKAAHWAEGNVLLLGDACHALHPGRSQGMNVALRVVEGLSELLHAPEAADTLARPEPLRACLKAFEAGLKPAIDQRLDENHAWGLEMDRLEPGAAEATERALRAVAADPEKLRRYCLNSAGY